MSDSPASGVTSDCGSCQNYGCCCPAPQLWDAGVEATFLHVSRRDPPGVDITSTVSVNNFDPASSQLTSEYGVGPRVWFGVALGDCWGVRTRFWSFRDYASKVFGDPGTLNDTVTGNFAEGGYDLSAYTIDVEATKAWGCGPWCFEASLGARYAQMHQDTLFAFYENTDETAAFGSNSRRISGTGLTASIEARRHLGYLGSACSSGCSCSSGWDVFANARGSILWGTTSGQAAVAAVDYFGEDSFASQANSLSNTSTLSIFEAQVGIEWTHPVKCICGTAFVRGACEYQRWSANDPGSAVAQQAVIGDEVTTVVTSSTPSPTVSLVGLDVAAGFRF